MTIPKRHYSASQLSLFLTRYDQWKDSYVDGNKPPTSREQAVGKIVHAGVQAFHLGDEPRNGFARAFEEEKHNIPAEDTDNQLSIAGRLLEFYVKTVAPELNIWPSGPTEAPFVEWEFCVPIPGLDVDVPLYGIIDFVDQRGGNPLIRDLKCVAKAQSLNACKKSIQRVVYHYAFRAATGLDPVGMVFDFVTKETPTRWIPRECPPVTDDEFDKLFEDLKRMDEEVRSYGGLAAWRE